jgi:hypothetical protein
MISMLRALSIRYIIDQKVLQEFLDTLVTIDEFRNDRNFIIHGQWIILMPEDIPAAMSLRPEAEAGGVVSERFPVWRLQEIVKGIESCRRQLLKLEADIRTSRDKFLRRHLKD